MENTNEDPKGTTESIRVSVVEDDDMIRDMMVSLFTFEPGLTFVAAYPNGESALAELGNAATDIVLMDISMPGMSGIECVRQLRPMQPNLQFLMYTVYDDDHRVFDALKAGANGYILKSSTPEQIIEAVLELKRGGAPMSTAVARRVVDHFRPVQENGAIREDKLSDREYEVLRLLADGLLYKEIGTRLNLTVGTVKQHIHRMYGKLHVQNRVEAVNRFYGR